MKSQNIHKNLLRGTAVILLVSVLAKLSSFISDAILAAYLGATNISDAYYMVSGIQQIIYPMISIGIWKVFLPIYKKRMTQGQQDKADELSNKTITMFSIVSIIVIVLLVLFSKTVVGLVAPGFDEETKDLCAELVRISAPMYLFIVAAAVYASMLQCHDKFFGSQIREVASHIPTILAALFFYKDFGVQALAYALIAGGLVRLLVELPFVDWKYRYKPDFNFKTEDMGAMMKRLPSSLLSESVTHINTLIDKIMASGLAVGTVSALSYGNKLVNVFRGLLSSAITTALYPQMIELISLNERKKLDDLIVKILNIFCVVMVPITFACILFRTEIVSAVYAHGSFDENAVGMTAGIFALYSLYLFSVACNTVLNNVFYGYGDTKIPLYISIANLIINVILNFVMIALLGANGLALATSLSSICNLILRFILVKKYVTIDKHSFFETLIKVIFISVIACGIPRIIFNFVNVNDIILLMCSALVGVFVYFVLIKILKIKEFDEIMNTAKSMLHKKRSS